MATVEGICSCPNVDIPAIAQYPNQTQKPEILKLTKIRKKMKIFMSPSENKKLNVIDCVASESLYSTIQPSISHGKTNTFTYN